MSQHYQGSSRLRKAPRMNKWQEERQKEDDLIAPIGVSGSTHHLERWALVTADMPQQPTKKAKSRETEEETQERIRRRYYFPRRLWPTASQDDPEPVNERTVVHSTSDDAQPKALSPTTTKKRHHSPSPTRNSLRTHLSSVSYVQTIKRRRSKSPSPRRSAYSAFSTQTYDARALSTAGSDEEYDYYQSSEWSFPSSDEEDEEMT